MTAARDFAYRALGHLSRRFERPELLAAAFAGAREELRDDVAQSVLVAAALRPESTFVDIGSNRGQWLAHAQRCAPGGAHHAFEPIPALAAQLRDQFPTAAVHEVALADH